MNARCSLRDLFFLSLPLMLFGMALSSCSVRTNNATTRFYHNLTTRYNVYHNGRIAYDEALQTQLREAPDNYVERLSLEPIVTLGSDRIKEPGGPFDRAIEKGRKAIRLHSIRTRPRDVNRSRKDQAFFRKREYNPFIHHAWLLVGESQYHNGDFLDAMSTFSYMARLYRDNDAIRDLARIWQARCYLAMHWETDAARLLGAVRQDAGSRNAALSAKAGIELALSEERFADALPMLDVAIRREKNKLAAQRYRFLKGQLQMEIAHYDEAKKSFQRVLAGAPPFSMEVAARLNIIGITGRSDTPKALRDLSAMMRHGRYEKVLDKVALAKGRLELSHRDSVAALRSFVEGSDKSVAKGYDYALCLFEASQINLAQRKYVDAARCLSEALSAAGEKLPDYDEWKQRSVDLDEVAGYARIIMEQDSLLTLASMPEKERLRVIDSAITAYKKSQRDAQRLQEMADLRASRDAFNEEMGGRLTPPRENRIVKEEVTDKRFYFYNAQLIERGKKEFQMLWGHRKLEDDWRRRNKDLLFTDNATESDSERGSATEAGSPSEGAAPAETEKPLDDTQNPEKRAYYLASLPLSDEGREACLDQIQEAYVGFGATLSERMMRYADGVVAYEELLHRFPLYKERQTIYYRLFILYELMADKVNANRYKALMQQQYPSDPLTTEIARPGYIETLQKRDSLTDALYVKAFEAYRRGDAPTAMALCDKLLADDPFSALRPKVLFIKALTYVLMGESSHFSETLRDLLKSYPKSEVAEIAEAMLSHLLSGRKIVQGGFAGIDFSHLYIGGENAQSMEKAEFCMPSIDDRYATLLLYPHDALPANELLFAVTSFHFSRFTDYNLELQLTPSPLFDQLTTKGLTGVESVRKYIREAYSPRGYMQLLDSVAVLIPISERNLQILHSGVPIGDYMNFVADSLSQLFPEVVFALERFADLASGREDAVTQGDGKDEKHLAPPPPSDGTDKKREATPQPQKDSAEAPPHRKVEGEVVQHRADSVRPRESAPIADSPQDSIHHPAEKAHSVTLETIRDLRQERIAEEREQAKQEKLDRKRQERERMERLRQREKERREREKARMKERREREKMRKAEQQRRERERREKLRQREQERRERAKRERQG